MGLMTRRPPTSTPKRIAFAVVATAAVLALLEGGFRVVVSATSARLDRMISDYRSRYYSQTNQELKYRPHPYFGYVRVDRGPSDEVNTLGFWGPEWPLEKPTDGLRVVALGGSTTAGPAAWPYQLGGMLDQALEDRTVDVINLGLGGWTSAEAVAAFSMIGVSYAPDVVVVHCVNNDLEPMRAMEPVVDYSHYRRAMNVVQTDSGSARFRQDPSDVVDALLAQASSLYVYGRLFQSGAIAPRASLHALTTWTRPTRAEPSAMGVHIYERNLRSIAALAEANGATMVVATMPILSSPRPGIPTIPDGHIRSLEAQNQRLRDLAAAEGWVLADLALLAEELTPYFEDAIHVSIGGEKIKARGVWAALVDAGVVQGTSAPSLMPGEASR